MEKKDIEDGTLEVLSRVYMGEGAVELIFCVSNCDLLNLRVINWSKGKKLHNREIEITKNEVVDLIKKLTAFNKYIE